jgi:diguanylate cyclase (GGDEF)-like protein/PAS domain S-box-containing protein
MLQQVMNTIPHRVSWKDRDSRYLGCNNRFLWSAGLETAADVVGKTDQEMPWRDRAASYRDDDRQIMETATPKYNYEEPEIVIDGRRTWLETSKVPLRDGSGKVVGVLAISQDITERKHAQDDQRQASVVIESTQEGVMITDAKGTIIRVNPAFTEITGYAAADALGRTPQILKSGRHTTDFYRVMWGALQGIGRWQGEIWNRRKTGEVYPEWLTISSVRDEQGQVVNYAAVFSDISQLKVSQEKLEHLAHHDPLTGLPNRLLFRDRLEHAMQRADRGDKALGVLFLDLDRFKRVNDSLGHTVGDAVLEAVATRLEGAVRRDDTLARLGGDEFTVLVEGVTGIDDPAHLATKLNQVLREPFRVQGHELLLGASIGISLYPQDAHSGEALLQNADAAMYHAKEAGRDTFRFYSQEMTTRALERVVLEGQLKRALENAELVLHYQPQLDLASHRVVGVEALVRWNHPKQGLLLPARFVPIAEESELIIALGNWVLRTACLQAKAWLDAGIDFGRIAVNVAGRQILQGGLKETVQRVLTETGLPPRRLELEIAETFMMRHPKQNVQLLLSVRELGVALAIDDFGTGYSSLAYLKQLPIDKLKLDRSFVHGLPEDGDDAAIAKAIIALGRSLQFRVIAEGLETEAQRDFLKAEHCEQAQGFLWSRPLAAEQLLPLLRCLRDGGSPDRPCPSCHTRTGQRD